ncbi:DUF4214 domain-containing protein [Acinetobacter cumulans]|uniref:DUF4214 domain-containing protein n=1 Tax=Acinetobacter cumulans TaxID=2136182 RepID=A0A498CSQ6_9GAMM|nr:DUF4214 domain-containing protein [Acinetobacter cumulans]RKG42243.1 DUF4214 domain-containing protein [Acinetobacter cumulans]RLL31235.1 DUF4214 domain-containing protein [Acinetobacter cumulans]RZG58165.1 DUF4214 domain-containing protein [Acinetobacter sp. WCHAc060006]
MTTLINIPKMLQYWGTPFVTILYRCFLNREPDPEGLKYYLGRLEQGIDRLTIIEQMLKSAETKLHFNQKDLTLIRLDVQRLKALSISGYLPVVRLFSTSMPKNQRILMNRLTELQFKLESNDIPKREHFLSTHSISFEKLKLVRNKNIKSLPLATATLNDKEQKLFNEIIKQL